MIAVRSSVSVPVLATLVRERLKAVDADVRLMRVVPFGDLLARPLARPRFNAFVLGVFGSAALLLSTVGLSAMLAAFVRHRDREIAVRMALGATATAVRRMVVAEASRLTGAGVLLGMACALVATQSLRGLLFEVAPLDPVSLGAAGVLIVMTAALAALRPVRRATRADILSVLRRE
jgi:ABC-type antimicrobial peptide transport system permease subunit